MYGNSNCNLCDIEKDCGYEYKPCDCCGYRKFKPKPKDAPQDIMEDLQTANNSGSTK